jgi:hypothetical protein
VLLPHEYRPDVMLCKQIVVDKPHSSEILGHSNSSRGSLFNWNIEMNAEELANKFRGKVSAAVVEKEKQSVIAVENQKANR